MKTNKIYLYNTFFFLIQILVQQLIIKKSHQCNKIFLISFYSISILGIFLYQIIKSTMLKTDPLQLIKIKYTDIDGWSITHFLFNFFLIRKCKSNKSFFIYIFLAGILWEILEEIYGYLVNKTVKYLTGKDDGVWWYGKISDIIINTIGNLLGYFL